MVTEEEFKNSIWILLARNDQKAISEICKYDNEKTIKVFDEFNNIIANQKDLEELENLIDRIYNDVTNRFKYYIDDNDVKIYNIKRKSIK